MSFAHRFLGTTFEVNGTRYIYDTRTQDIHALEPDEDLEEIKASLAGPLPRLVPPHLPLDHDNHLQQLVLNLTNRCNLRCAYCLHGSSLEHIRPHGPEQMSPDVARRAAAYFLDRCTTTEQPVVSFYGGEPMLRPQLIRAVAVQARSHPRGADARLVVDTNGYLLSEEMIQLVKEFDLGLQVSIDGPAEAHDRYRRTVDGKPTFARMMGNLDALLEAVPQVHERMNFVCTLAPGVDLDAVENFWDAFPLYRRHGIEGDPVLTVSLANLRGVAWENVAAGMKGIEAWMQRARERYLEALRDGREDEAGLFLRVLVGRPLTALHERSDAVLGETFAPGANCVPGQRKLMVSAEGEFGVCERMGQGAGIGDVYSGIDKEAVKGLTERFFEEVGRHCQGCWALRVCGVCFAGWWGERGAGDWLGGGVCDRVRGGLVRDLGFLVRGVEMGWGRG